MFAVRRRSRSRNSLIEAFDGVFHNRWRLQLAALEPVA